MGGGSVSGICAAEIRGWSLVALPTLVVASWCSWKSVAMASAFGQLGGLSVSEGEGPRDSPIDNHRIFVPSTAGGTGDDGAAYPRQLGLADSDWITIQSQPNSLGGNTLPVINGAFVGILGLLVAFAAMFNFAERSCSLADPNSGRPPGWQLGLLGTSYALLLPGIFGMLFSYNIFVELHVTFATIPVGYSNNLTPDAVTESMASFVRLLLDSGGTIGAVLVIFYAMVLPALKVVLLVVGEFWRRTPSPEKRLVAHRSIRFVQMISKWASPDMFAYILLLYLLRNLGHPPEVQSTAQLDIGFVCFSIFCVLSTLSSLAIKLPEDISDRARRGSLASPTNDDNMLMGYAFGFALLFAVLLGFGISQPCMGLRLRVDSLIAPNGPVPETFRSTLEELHLEKKVGARVSLTQCMQALYAWAAEGESASAVGFVLLGVFVIILTVLDVAALLWAALKIGTTMRQEGMTADQLEKARGHLRRLLEYSRLLKHVSMLDVFCMGVVVVCLAGSAYRNMGIDVEVLPGIGLLVAAEACHVALYWKVHSAAGSHAAEATSAVLEIATVGEHYLGVDGDDGF